MKRKNRVLKKQGVSLYFAILILSVLTGSLLVLVSISISQIRVIWSSGDSVSAFYSADTGVEEALYRLRQEGNAASFSGEIGGAEYQVNISIGTEFVIKSVGSYRQTKRAIETRY